MKHKTQNCSELEKYMHGFRVRELLTGKTKVTTNGNCIAASN